MKMTESPQQFAAAVMQTPIKAICVKKKDKTLQQLIDDDYAHGVIVVPPIERGQVKNNEELQRKLVENKEPFVTVRGHGWSHERKFVWTGTTAEFLATWEGD